MAGKLAYIIFLDEGAHVEHPIVIPPVTPPTSPGVPTHPIVLPGDPSWPADTQPPLVDPGYGYPEKPVDPGYGVPVTGMPHPEHPIYFPSDPPPPPESGVKPPPPEGGWGYHSDYGWGYFPGTGGTAGPKGGRRNR